MIIFFQTDLLGPILNGCSRMDKNSWDDKLYAFNASASRTFAENQCRNADNQPRFRCLSTELLDGPPVYYLYSYIDMTADFCKKVCIAKCKFKYAALYE